MTITIDIEAYELLVRHQEPGQSFSQVIKQRFGSPITAAELLRRAATTHLSADALAGVRLVVRRRRGDFAAVRRARPVGSHRGE